MSAAELLALVLGAAIVGFSKTAVSGVSTLAVVLYAVVLPVRESIGVLLVLLMAGDVLAVCIYRRHADWATLRGLLLPVTVGIGAGAAFLALAPTDWLRPLIGLVVVAMTLLQVRRRFAPGSGDAVNGGRPAAVGFGSLAGFTTMVANAGGPVMSLYLLRSRLEVARFVGTTAWFFACVNATKLPISIGLGLLRPQRILLCLMLIPAVVVGALVGRWTLSRISQALFESVVLVVAGLSGAYLLFA
ncbi:MAG TPA: sulfite exporter TauE/SafE family protein [Flexivirga sp.]|uniref:sulfite exporter TauE/SafE family protein n=1 Tax=Flexivirga sp. TaxID=1962927 RepID=UPI002B5818C1|nr:sulfite exporter TauE/SafE family protein [Flexivirga sp.]HWC21910.1 sulfite exporter TauE/SafE family protein [Flexivirga sp.]